MAPFSKTNRKYFKKRALPYVKKYFRNVRSPIRSWRSALQNLLYNRVRINAVETELWNSWRMQASYVMKFPQYLPRRGTRLQTRCSSQSFVLYYTVTASNHVPQICNSKSHSVADHIGLCNKNEKLNYTFLCIIYLIPVQHNQWERINGYSLRPCKNSPEIVRNVLHIRGVIIRAVCPTVCEIFTT